MLAGTPVPLRFNHVGLVTKGDSWLWVWGWCLLLIIPSLKNLTIFRKPDLYVRKIKLKLGVKRSSFSKHVLENSKQRWNKQLGYIPYLLIAHELAHASNAVK